MTPPRIAAVFVTLALGTAPAVHAQVRDAGGAAARPATGVITGTVVTSDDSPRPVRRATVNLNSADPFLMRAAITDDAGRFAFTDLPAARYSLSASKRGWVTGSFGAKAIGRPGRGLQLGPGQRATATMQLTRGAVVTGTVLDQFGQPVSGVSLRVLRYGYAVNTGDRRLIPTGATFSGPDERGAYRLYGLAPGDYYLSASNPSITFNSGRDLHLTSDVDVDEALKAAQQGPAVSIADVPQRKVGFTQIFYPGTASAAQATVVTVRAGEERSGVDLTITYSPTARVEGSVTTPTGSPVQARVTLVVNDPASPGIGIESIRNTTAGADGRFTFAEIAPGPYVLSASATLPAASAGERPQALTTSSDLDVPPDGVTGLSVMLQEGLTLSGVVRYEGTPPGPNVSSMRVSLQAVQNTNNVSISTGGQTTAADGRFTFTGVSPGRYRLTVNAPGPQATWRVSSATLLGQEALDSGVELRQDANDAVITLTDRIAELAGKVEGPAGMPLDYTMILFAADRAYWRPMSRRVLIARLATDGTFSFRNVPPGDYQLAPVDDVEPGEWFDPSFLQRIAPTAIRVTVGDGEKKVQDIRVGGG